MNVVRDFHFNSSEERQRSDLVSEVKQRSERSQRFHLNNSEGKQRSERSQRFHFNSSATKTL